ncbi:MAG: hypothetical protein Q8M92_08620, partial [Candidatus Subteraquimicrobiales bacterium]|nr:hypothetical protein [Candidatus Subteraquimicrobiales bacterium]
MIIVPQIVTTDQIVLELIFTTEETEHPLIETVKTDLNQEKSLSMETVDTGEKQIITRPIN